jgi:stearoyl-CoA desaturase (delta-9 desaturase)
MTRIHKLTNLIAVVLPPAALVAAIVLLWNKAIGPLELTLFVVMYLLTALGVTLGYHRLFTHRSFETSRAFRAIIAVLGSMAVEGSVITWVADHRKHHAFTDIDGDPHSPHLAGPGLSGAIKGLWHAHVGWLFENVGQSDRMRFAPDLMKDGTLRVIDKLFFLWLALGLLIPFGIGYAVGGTPGTALTCLLWGGLVRVFLLQHVTWSINSVCHFFGRRRFEVKDESRNVFWLAPFSLGEGWHHNHHAFPTSAFHGLTLSERLADPTGLLIALLEKLGLVWNVVRISPEKQAAKLASATQAAKSAAANARLAASTAAANAAANAKQAATSAQSAAANAKQAAVTAAQNAASNGNHTAPGTL